MVTVPLVALLAVWLFATVLTADPALTLLSARTLAADVANPGEVVITELQRERRLSVQYLADPSATLGLLTEQRAATDRAIDDFRRAAQGGDAWRSASDTLRTRINQMFTELNVLPSQRAHIDHRELDPIGAQNIYNGMVSAGFDMFAATATFPDGIQTSVQLDGDPRWKMLAPIATSMTYRSPTRRRSTRWHCLPRSSRACPSRSSAIGHTSAPTDR